MTSKRIKIGKASEQDIILVMPNGKEVIIQYRNYGDEDSQGYPCATPCIDIILPENCPVSNWEGSDMKPATACCKKSPEVRMADQLCIPLRNDGYPL